ncbi:16S rRNA methyltransferase [Saccharobesus litoralis]|uniref:16S rRNA methyltransferase n=1 Tax=Saccharobesus litoralis TaxID=2172099 RepID=A0A2S0VR86_9ALTE|nr:methyltransferase [Saccharobesus litoralis]AWB66735.1 16S rRNA methyltransferase [Saccharobesus litoralis]
MLSAPSQLLEKHLELLISGTTLVIDPLVSDQFTQAHWPEMDTWLLRDIDCPSKGTSYLYPNSPAQKYNNIIVFYPKSKEKLNVLIDLLSPYCHDNCQILFVGENKGGIKSLKKQSTHALQFVNKLASGKHCLLYRASLIPDYQASDVQPKPFEFTINTTPMPVASLPGVFCHGRLDEGTQLLLENLPSAISGNIYDLACGCGVIGTYIAKHYQIDQLVLSDIDCFAVESAKNTLQLNDVQGKCITSNGLMKISSKFDWIFTNPPFHTGVKIDYDITVAFFRDCKAKLKPNGKLVVVANSFLKYPPLLQTHFQRVDVIAQNNKFKLYVCS